MIIPIVFESVVQVYPGKLGALVCFERNLLVFLFHVVSATGAGADLNDRFKVKAAVSGSYFNFRSDCTR